MLKSPLSLFNVCLVGVIEISLSIKASTAFCTASFFAHGLVFSATRCGAVVFPYCLSLPVKCRLCLSHSTGKKVWTVSMHKFARHHSPTDCSLVGLAKNQSHCLGMRQGSEHSMGRPTDSFCSYCYRLCYV